MTASDRSGVVGRSLPGISGDTLFTLLLTAFVGWLNWLSFSYTVEARRLPVVIGVPTFAVLLLVSLSQLIESFELPDVGPDTFEKVMHEDLEEDEEPEERLRAWQAIGWVVGLFGLLWTVGILAGTFLLTYFFLTLEGAETHVRAGVIGLGAAGSVYLIFEVVLDSHLYPGVLVELLA